MALLTVTGQIFLATKTNVFRMNNFIDFDGRHEMHTWLTSKILTRVCGEMLFDSRLIFSNALLFSRELESIS
jgi:hypothetical protein